MANKVKKQVLDEISSEVNPEDGSQNSPENIDKDDPASLVLVDKFVIRLPEGLRNQIKELSELNHRSMNSEIIMVLQKHVQLHSELAMDSNGDSKESTESTLAEQEVNKRLEDLKESLLQLMS